MELSYPIPTNPEFSILERPGYREYRVENRRRPSQRQQGIILFFLFFSLAVALYWQSVNLFCWFLTHITSADYCLAKLSGPGYTFLVALTIVSGIIVFGFFGQVLYGEVVFF